MEVRCEPAVYLKAELSQATLHLTRIDQLRNYNYASILFYQGADQDHVVESIPVNMAMLLQAVRLGVEAMVDHYPWAAGRIRACKQPHISPIDGGEDEEECLEVYINEDGGPGVQLVGAHVNRPLHSLGDLSNPNPTFEPLFAKIHDETPCHSRPLVALQVSRFECGGFSVAMTSNHVLFDGIGASIYLQNVASCARGKGICLPLDLAPRTTRIFPRNPPTPTLKCALNVVPKKHVKELPPKEASFLVSLAANRFVFTHHDLVELRSHALARQEDCKRGFQACSRFQVLTAHLWRAKARCMMAFYGGDPLEQFSLHVTVNLRERIISSIPRNYVGNALGVARPAASLRDLMEKSLAFAVESIQEAIQKVTIDSFQSDVDHLEILGNDVCIVHPIMTVPNLTNLGFYDVDFGWGKPIYFGRHFKQTRNRVIIMAGNAECTSLNVLATFVSEDEHLIFQDALKLWKSCD